MSRTFDGGSTAYIEYAQSALLTPSNNVTICCWVKRNGNQAVNDRIFEKVYNNALTSPYVSFGMEWQGTNTAYMIAGPGGVLTLTSTVTVTDATWTHLLGTYDSAAGSNQLKIYKDGVHGGSATGTGAIAYSGSSGFVHIGGRGTSGEWMAGDIAECAIWDATLDADEIVSLSKAASPLLVRPASLIFYAPLVGRLAGEPDIISGLTGTVGAGATAGDHPRVRLKSSRNRTVFADAAGGGSPVTVTPTTLALTLTTFAPTVSTPRLCTPTTAALTLTTFAPPAVVGHVVTPSTATLNVTTYAPTVSTPRVCTPATATLSTTLYAPTVSTPRTVTPTPAALALTSYAPTVATPRTCTPPTLALTASPFAPSVTVGQRVTPGTLALSLAAYAPTIVNPQSATPGTLALALTLYAPTVTATTSVVPDFGTGGRRGTFRGEGGGTFNAGKRGTFGS